MVFLVLVAWLTHWTFALFCFGSVYAGLAATGAARTAVPDKPRWMSSPAGRLLVTSISTQSFGVLPLLVGLVWFHWWWGPVGYLLVAVGAVAPLGAAAILILYWCSA